MNYPPHQECIVLAAFQNATNPPIITLFFKSPRIWLISVKSKTLALPSVPLDRGAARKRNGGAKPADEDGEIVDVQRAEEQLRSRVL